MNAELTAEFTERAGVFRRELLAFCYRMLGSAEDGSLSAPAYHLTSDGLRPLG